MLQNRIVRALIGVVFAKAAVATGWYFYQKSFREHSKENNETTEKEVKNNIVQLKAPIKTKVKPALINVAKTAKKHVAALSKSEGKLAPKKSRVRKPKAIAIYKNEVTANLVKKPANKKISAKKSISLT